VSVPPTRREFAAVAAGYAARVDQLEREFVALPPPLDQVDECRR